VRAQAPEIDSKAQKCAYPEEGKTSAQPICPEGELERYRAFFDEARDACVIAKNDGTIIDVNQAWLDLYGYTREDISNLTVRDCYFNPEDRVKFRKAVDQKGSVKDYESDQLKKDGTRMTCLLTSTAKEIREENVFIGYMGIIRDITEQKLAERALAQKQEALQAVYEMSTSLGHSLQSICEKICDSLSRLLQVSHVAVRQLSGGRSTTIAFVGEDNQTILSKIIFDSPPFVLPQKRKRAQQFKGELDQAFPQNGLFSSFYLRSYLGVPIKNSIGNVIGLIDILDREERTYTGAEIQLVQIFVRYIGNEVERQLMEKQLRDTNRMKILGQMAAGIAHEVRNPLAALTAVTEALSLELQDSQDYRCYVDHMITQMQRLSRLMKGLLDLGKPIESTNLYRESLIDICGAAVDLWRKANVEKKQALIFTYPKEASPILILADSAKLQQVLFNLLNNSVEASDKGSEIRVVVSKISKKYVCISVIDHGIGIRHEHFPLIFEPFFTTKTRGTGLGLSIVKNIIELHNGSIKVFPNTPRPGCTVRITLPLAARL